MRYSVLFLVAATTAACSTESQRSNVTSVELRKPSEESSILFFSDTEAVYGKLCTPFQPDPSEAEECKRSGETLYGSIPLAMFRSNLLTSAGVDIGPLNRLAKLESALADLKALRETEPSAELEAEIEATVKRISDLMKEHEEAYAQAEELMGALADPANQITYNPQEKSRFILAGFDPQPPGEEGTIVTSDGSQTRPFCSWRNTFEWNADVQQTCAQKLFEAAGFANGSFIDAAQSMCESSAVSGTHHHYVWDEKTFAREDFIKEAVITARCFQTIQKH